jgi:hypothetical protein
MTSSLRDVSRQRDRPHCAVLACVPRCEARRKVSPLHGSNDAFGHICDESSSLEQQGVIFMIST